MVAQGPQGPGQNPAYRYSATAVQLPFDGDGRIVLPKELLDFAGIEGSANFVGLGKKFQIWNPKTFKKRREDARTQVKVQGLTIPRGGKE
jgi:MraZ protein